MANSYNPSGGSIFEKLLKDKMNNMFRPPKEEKKSYEDIWRPASYPPIRTTTGTQKTGPFMTIVCGECGVLNVPKSTSCVKCGAKFEVIEIVQGDRKGELMALYHVFMVYAEDRDDPIIEDLLVVADNDEQAKLKAGFTPEKGWDLDYLTVYATPVCQVVVKERPQEVLQVTKSKKK